MEQLLYNYSKSLHMRSRVVTVCFAGAGVAHADRETEDEERGGAAGSGNGFGPRCGGVRSAHTRSVRYTPLFNAAYVTLRCKYCKTLMCRLEENLVTTVCCIRL